MIFVLSPVFTAVEDVCFTVVLLFVSFLTVSVLSVLSGCKGRTEVLLSGGSKIWKAKG